MELLTPEKIKRDQREGGLEAQKRSIGMAAEESRVVRSLNLTRSSAEEQQAEIARDIEKAKSDAEATKLELTRDIQAAEERKRIAMLPVDELKRQAEEVLSKAKEKEAQLDTDRKAFEEDKQKLKSDQDAAKATSQTLDVREAVAADREKKATESEGRNYQARTKLSDDQLAHAEKVRQDEKRLEERGADLAEREKKAEKRREEQDARDTQQDARSAELDEMLRKVQGGEYAPRQRRQRHI